MAKGLGHRAGSLDRIPTGRGRGQQEVEDSKSFYSSIEPVKLTLAGLTTSNHPAESHPFLKEFPFLQRHGSGDPSDLDLSAAFENGSRGAVS